MMDFDTMLLHVGEFGLYQKILFAFQAPFCIFVTFVLFGQTFILLYPMNYWCEDHFRCIDDNSVATPAQRRNISFVWRDGGLFQTDSCHLNNINRDFLSRLHFWDASNCATKRLEVCPYNDMNPSSSPSSSSNSRKPQGPTNYWPTPPASLVQPKESEGELVRRKRQYGGRRNYPTTTSTTTYEPDEWEYNGNGGGSGGNRYMPSEKEKNYGSSSGSTGSSSNRYPGSSSSSSDRYPGSSSSSSDRYPGSSSDRYPGSSSDRYPGSSLDRYPGSSSDRYPGSSSGRYPGTSSSSSDRYPGSSSERYPGSSSGDGYPYPGSSGNRPQTSSTKPPFGEQGKQKGSPSTGQLTDVRSPFAGWEKPSCPTDRFPFVLGGNTTILADQMNQRHNNKSWESIENCKIRWNRSEIPYETIVTEGNWWCNAEFYFVFTQAMFFLGAIVGGFLIGWIADTFGRVPALVIANILGALGGALSAVSTNVWVFSIFRFITGMAFDNCFTMMYILVLEFCGPSYRTLVANLSIAVFYTLGTLMIPALAYFISNWKIFALVISLPMLLALLALFFVPESARWLLSKGRAKEATNILRNFAKVNRRKVDEKVFVDFEHDATKLFAELAQETDEEPGLAAAFRTPRLRRTFMLLIIFWAMIALVYDGHSRNILNLANEDLSVFWMFGIASMTEFPADMMLIFTLDRFGRRWLAFGSMTLSAAFSFIAAAITAEMRTPYLITAIISRFWVNVAFNIGLQYAAELLPTVIRAQGVNAIHIMGYVASIISPFVAAIGRNNPTLSLILLGIFSITAGFTALFLAETLGEELPNTLEEAEAFGKNQSFWNCPICAKEGDEFPIHPAPAAQEERSVVLRNAMRGSIRGETYRSSMISHTASAGSRRSRYINPRDQVMQDPQPTELTKLRRITH